MELAVPVLLLWCVGALVTYCGMTATPGHDWLGQAILLVVLLLVWPVVLLGRISEGY